jgi:hypothetical protein
VDGVDSLGWIVDHYGVPAEVGQRVTHDGDPGVVKGAEGAHVAVQFDGDDFARPCHPLSLDYDDGIDPQARLDHRNARIETWNDRLNGRIGDDEYRERMSVPVRSGPRGGGR